MNDVLEMCRDMPEIRLATGDTLIEEAIRTDRLYVLKSGGFEVVRNGVRVVSITEPGAFLGEISAVLGSAPTARVVAEHDSSVHVVDGETKARPDVRDRAIARAPAVRRDRLTSSTSSASTPTAIRISR